MKILILDIETRPALGYIWSLWDQNVALSQVQEHGEVICFAAKWYGHKKVHFKSVYHHTKEEMVQAAWDLMDEADAIVHYNGRSFDIKHLKKEFLLQGLTPPSPHKDIDLLTEVRANFKFESNKLDNIATRLGLGSKTAHDGFALWKGCMEGDKASWNKMKEYNISDIDLTEQLYETLLPWIRNHPNVALYDGIEELACPNCKSEDYQRRGYARTNACTYVRYCCNNCGKYFRGRSAESGTDSRSIY